MSKFLVYGLANGMGGVESIVTSIAKHLPQHEFDILLSKGNCAYESSFTGNMCRVNLTPWGTSLKLFSKELKAILRSNCYDYIWINGCIMSNSTIVKLAHQYSKAKIITHSHGSSFEEKNLLKRWILLGLHYWNRDLYQKSVDFPCMCSKRSGEWYYGKHFCASHTIHLVKNGIDISRFCFNENIRAEYREKLGLNDEYVLFHAGRLTEVKNQRFIIEILSELVRMKVNAKLLIAGTGELLDQLKHITKQLNINDFVIFLGQRNDVAQLYQAADCFLLPSFHEGLPVTLIEAQTAGLPCFVSTGVTSEADVSGNVSFWDLATTDASLWAQRIRKQMSVKRDRGEFKEIVSKSGYFIKDVANDFISMLK